MIFQLCSSLRNISSKAKLTHQQSKHKETSTNHSKTETKPVLPEGSISSSNSDSNSKPCASPPVAKPGLRNECSRHSKKTLVYYLGSHDAFSDISEAELGGLDPEILELVDRVGSRLFKLDRDLCGMEINPSAGFYHCYDTSISSRIPQSKSNLESMDLASPFSDLSDHKSIVDARLGRYMYYHTNINRTVSSLSLGHASIATEDIVPEMRASVRASSRIRSLRAKNMNCFLNEESIVLRHVDSLCDSVLPPIKDEEDDIRRISMSRSAARRSVPLFMDQYEQEEKRRACHPDQAKAMQHLLSQSALTKQNRRSKSLKYQESRPDRYERAQNRSGKDSRARHLANQVSVENIKKQQRIKKFIYDHKPSSAFESLLQEVARSQVKHEHKRSRQKIKELKLRAKVERRLSKK